MQLEHYGIQATTSEAYTTALKDFETYLPFWVIEFQLEPNSLYWYHIVLMTKVLSVLMGQFQIVIVAI